MITTKENQLLLLTIQEASKPRTAMSFRELVPSPRVQFRA